MKAPVIIGSIAVLTVLLFILDLQLPLGVAGGVPYVLVVLLSLWSTRPWLPIQLAVLCSLLTVTGFFWSPEGGELWKVLANRFLALFAIWATGVLCFFRKKTEEKLTAANRELDAFVYTVSHDLRTPLTAIIGYADLLKDQYADRLDEQAIDCLNEIGSSGEKVVRMMEDLLALAKLGQVARPATPVDAREIAEEVANLLQHQNGAQVSISIGALPALRIPRTLLTGIFSNLIENALRYGSKPGDVIEVGGERAWDRVRFYVRDHGPGIPTGEQTRIFEVFSRGSTGQGQEGTGVGLATIQKTAHLYQGRSWVEETPGGGSTFWIELFDPPL